MADLKTAYALHQAFIGQQDRLLKLTGLLVLAMISSCLNASSLMSAWAGVTTIRSTPYRCAAISN
jgi:hypothetical protein